MPGGHLGTPQLTFGHCWPAPQSPSCWAAFQPCPQPGALQGFVETRRRPCLTEGVQWGCTDQLSSTETPGSPAWPWAGLYFIPGLGHLIPFRGSVGHLQWFDFPNLLYALLQHFPVLCAVKCDSPQRACVACFLQKGIWEWMQLLAINPSQRSS